MKKEEAGRSRDVSFEEMVPSLFPVFEKQEVRKHPHGLLITGQNRASKTWRHINEVSDSSLIQSGEGDDHLSSADVFLSSQRSLDCVFLTDTGRVCVLLNLRPHTHQCKMHVYAICVCNNYCLHVCRFRWVCGGAASVSAEMHQHIWFL